MDISNFLNNLNEKNEKNSKDEISANDEKLIEILQEISNDYLQEGEIEKYKKRLKIIYDSENFRHKYSQITSYLLTIKKENKNETFGFISHNISKIYNEINEDDTIKQQVLKLSDHINLEILRIKDINTFKKEFQQAEKNLKQTKTKIKNMECDLKEAKETIKEISNLNDEVKSSRREYITILGVFASIILAFVAGLSFSNAVLSNIDKASIYRLSFIVCLIGLFITNILYYLYKFIKDIHFNNYSNKSKDQKSKFCNSDIRKFNVFIAIIILCIFIVWAFETEIKHFILFNLFC